MIAYPAIDLRQRRVVQLIGGRTDRERVSLPDPLAVARRFVAHGFAALHVVDLDGALQQGSNADDVRAILDAVDVPVQVGGGIRSRAALAAWIEAGASRAMVGTRAIDDHEWLRAASAAFPHRIMVAADVRDGAVMTHGWTRSSGLAVTDFIESIADLPLAGLLITDVGREGSLSGIDTDLFTRLVATTTLPIVAAGGIGAMQDLRDLDSAGLAGAVVGTALYTGAIDPDAAAEEFNHD